MATITKTKTSTPRGTPKGVASNAQVLETLRDLGSGTVASTREAAFEIGHDFFRQLIGLPEQKIKGTIAPGESLSIEEALTGVAEERKRLELQLARERQMRAEEQRLSTRKQQELKMQMAALQSEVVQLAQTTQGLSHEVQIAAMSAPVEPGVYHLIFFEKLIEFIRSFRKKIENASTWLAMYNARAKKRAHTFWAQVGVSGAKRLLSPEDYIQRSAA